MKNANHDASLTADNEVRPYLTSRDRALADATLMLTEDLMDLRRLSEASVLESAELLRLAEHLVNSGRWPGAGEHNALTDYRRSCGEPSSDNLVTLSDHQTTVVDQGTGGTPLILIHSLGLDWRMSRHVIPEVARGGRVIAYDLRLHGSAHAAAPETFTLEQCADDLLLLMDTLGIERAHVVGFSLGGAVAQVFALRHPTRLAALGLVATMASSDGTTYRARADAAESFGMDSQVSQTMQRWFNGSDLANNNWAVRYAREKIRTTSTRNWARYWRALDQINTAEQLHTIAAPTLVLAAEQDASTPPETMQKIAKSIPQSSFHVIAGAPHMVSLHAPDQVAQLLLSARQVGGTVK